MSSKTKECTEPRLLRYEETRRYLWGDPTSRQVVDWYYASSTKLHVAMFSLASGAHWRHSDTHKAYYGADECYYLLQGSLTFHNPKTGEVYVVEEGEAMHFRKETWHYGYNFSLSEVLIVCGFAPVPPNIASAAELARNVPPLKEVRGGRYELLGNWPWNSGQIAETETIKVLRPANWLHLIQGDKAPLRVSLFVSTENLTMGLFPLLPGVVADPETHAGDLVAFVAEGKANVYLPEKSEWIEIGTRDGCFIPEGVRFQYANTYEQPARVVFAVAPKY